jgi:hypothetical protein
VSAGNVSRRDSARNRTRSDVSLLSALDTHSNLRQPTNGGRPTAAGWFRLRGSARDVHCPRSIATSWPTRRSDRRGRASRSQHLGRRLELGALGSGRLLGPRSAQRRRQGRRILPRTRAVAERRPVDRVLPSSDAAPFDRQRPRGDSDDPRSAAGESRKHAHRLRAAGADAYTTSAICSRSARARW